MNYKLNLIIIILLVITATFSCKKDEVLNGNTDSVIKSYSNNLPNGVLSVDLIGCSNKLYIKAINSTYFKNANINELSENMCIYHYANGVSALLVSNIEESRVFTYLYENKTERVVDSFYADFNFEQKISSNNIELVPLFNNGNNLKTWGSCMQGAIDVLYNDWTDDPVGTFTCWVNGPMCAIGGGIACAIKS